MKIDSSDEIYSNNKILFKTRFAEHEPIKSKNLSGENSGSCFASDLSRDIYYA